MNDEELTVQNFVKAMIDVGNKNAKSFSKLTIETYSNKKGVCQIPNEIIEHIFLTLKHGEIETLLDGLAEYTEMLFQDGMLIDKDKVQMLEQLKRILEEHKAVTEDMTPSQKLRLEIFMELQKRHGSLKISTRTLHLLSPKLKNEARSIGYILCGNNPDAKMLIDTALSPPKKHRRKQTDILNGDKLSTY